MSNSIFQCCRNGITAFSSFFKFEEHNPQIFHHLHTGTGDKLYETREFDSVSLGVCVYYLVVPMLNWPHSAVSVYV